ncbi:MAG: T9SS type A sorting domain-containing protein, partial [Chlorobi bacterium]|nr:T9SS type A sorting domain-containing protein [Chlorobiota bacterium]
KTTNGGFNWLQQTSGTNDDLTRVFFVNSSTGWASGSNGTILKTTTGGATSVIQISSEIPKEFSLSQNYPNPFNPQTNIEFAIPRASIVQLAVYDMLGKGIEILVNEKLNAGIFKTGWNASVYPSGVYFYKLTSGDFTETKKMILMK